MEALADYAKCAQDNGMVPIVEPEVLMDGNHSIDECYDATERSLKSLFSYLKKRCQHQGYAIKAKHGNFWKRR